MVVFSHIVFPFGKYIIKAVNFYKAAGIKNVDYKLYPAARHEILNETNKSEVYSDILELIEKLIADGK